MGKSMKIAWTEPASKSIPDAPEHLQLWAYCEMEMSKAQRGSGVAKRLGAALGITAVSVRRAIASHRKRIASGGSGHPRRTGFSLSSLPSEGPASPAPPSPIGPGGNGDRPAAPPPPSEGPPSPAPPSPPSVSEGGTGGRPPSLGPHGPGAAAHTDLTANGQVIVSGTVIALDRIPPHILRSFLRTQGLEEDIMLFAAGYTACELEAINP